MGLYLGQQDNRSKLQEKIAADLREKAKKAQELEYVEPNNIEDLRYFEGTKQTTTLGWAWMLIALLAAGVVIMFLMQGR